MMKVSLASVPLGGRCTFEEIGNGLSEVGCPGWSIETYYVHNGKRVDGEEHLLMCLNATAATKYASPKHIPLRDHTFEHINSSGSFFFNINNILGIKGSKLNC